MPNQNLSELAIIEAIRMGSEKILFNLYDEYRNEFIGWAVTNNQLDVNEAKDIFQNTIISFHQNIKNGKFKGGNSSLKTYLFSIGKNNVKQYFRANKNLFLHDELSDYTLKVVEEENTELNDIVRQAITRIGKRCKSILTLFYERGFDMESIAIELGFKNRDVAKKSKYECMKKLEVEVKSRLKSA